MKIVIILVSLFLLACSIAGQQTDVYFTPVINNLAPGNMTMGYFYDIAKPGEAMYVTGYSFQIYNALNNETVPVEDVYLHHIFLIEFFKDGNKSANVIAGTGGQATRTPHDFPKGYGILVPVDAVLIMSYDLINTWGVAAMANISVYIGYNLTWVPASQKFKNLIWILIDVTGFPVGNTTYNVPSSCPKTNNVYTKTLTFTWPNVTSDIIYAIGHIHIGGLSSTLTDHTGAIICQSEADYNNYGYLNVVNPCTPTNSQFVKGASYTLSVNYACAGYGDVMGMMALWYSLD